MKRLLCFCLGVCLLTGCGGVKAIEESSDAELVVVGSTDVLFSETTSGSPTSRGEAKFTETLADPNENSFGVKKLVSSHFVTIQGSIRDGIPLVEISDSSKLTESGRVNIYFDEGETYLNNVLRSKSDVYALGLSESEVVRLIHNHKGNGVLTWRNAGMDVYAFIFGYPARQVTIVSADSDNYTTLYAGYEGVTLNTEYEGDAVRCSIEEEAEESTEAESELEFVIEEDISSVEFDEYERVVTVYSSSGKVYTFNLNLYNYDVTLTEEGAIIITNMESGEFFELRAHSTEYVGAAEEVKHYGSGYSLYLVDLGAVLVPDDSSCWIEFGVSSEEDAIAFADELVG